MSDDILTDEQRAAVQPVMEAALAWVVADEKADIVRAHHRLALTVALALAEARTNALKAVWAERQTRHLGGVVRDHCGEAEAECTRLREALGE